MADPSIPAPIAGYLDRTKAADARVVPLTGDASDRRYFRILPRDGEPFVLAAYGSPFEYGSLPFVNTAELFGSMPVPVPRILGHAEDLGVLALEDLGDVTLQAHLGSAPAARRPIALTAIPYHAWANRESGAMRVWIPRTEDRA